jgi:hypothetical protein
MMRRPIFALCALLASGCASAWSGDPVQSAREPRAEQRGDSYYIDLPAEMRAVSFRIPGTPQRLFPLVAQVYQDLGIPLETIETAAYRLGNTRFRTRRQVGKLPMSTVVDCGGGISGARSDTYFVTLNVLTQLKAAGADSVAVETTLHGMGQAADGTSTNAVNCPSRGALERYIADQVKAQLGS